MVKFEFSEGDLEDILEELTISQSENEGGHTRTLRFSDAKLKQLMHQYFPQTSKEDVDSYLLSLKHSLAKPLRHYIKEKMIDFGYLSDTADENILIFNEKYTNLVEHSESDDFRVKILCNNGKIKTKYIQNGVSYIPDEKRYQKTPDVKGTRGRGSRIVGFFADEIDDNPNGFESTITVMNRLPRRL